MPPTHKRRYAIGFFSLWIVYAGYFESRHTSVCTVCQHDTFCLQTPNPDVSVSSPDPELPISDSTDDRQTDDLTLVQRQYDDSVLSILELSCRDCHWGDSAEAGFNLEAYQTIEQMLGDRQVWEKVRTQIAFKQMPPPDEVDPLPEGDQQAVLEWLDNMLGCIDCTEINPGQVPLRRLNRTEYRNTISDLIGIDYQPANDFPGDEVGYGFDNIANVISLPPILMEKYLTAAETIAEQAIVDTEAIRYRKRIAGSDLIVGSGAKTYQTYVVLFTNTTVKANVELPLQTDYLITIGAFGDQVGDEPIRLSVRWNGKTVVGKNVQADADEPEEIEIVLAGKQGSNRLEVSFLNDVYKPRRLGQPGFDRNLHITAIEIESRENELPASHQKLIGEPVPEQKMEQQALARKILKRFGRRAFRRPVTPAELTRYTALYDQARDEGDRFELALRYPIQAMLVSPHFLYKVEMPLQPEETRRLSSFELATSLSYFLWSTMPDDELLELAAADKLQDEKVYFQQIKRMLAAPQASALVNNFVEQWLQLRLLNDLQPDPGLFPDVDPELCQLMATETRLLLQDLIRRDASITELFDSDDSFVNERLARFYGLEGVRGDEFRKVSMKPTGRRGLLTHASILTLTSNPTRTSPVKRGKWMMENLLGQEPPPPDPEAMQIEDQQELTGSIRERTEQHRSNPKCASCHQVMDELGFALEHYDAIGRWRDDDDGHSIDARGLLPDGTKFDGARQLQEVLNTSMKEQWVRCLVEKMLIYAIGRGLEYYDRCTVDKIMVRLQQQDDRFSALIHGIATSDPFLKRQNQSHRNTSETKERHD